MPRSAPLPPRHGLNPAWVRTPDRGQEAPWATMREFLLDKLGPGRPDVDPMLQAGEFVDDAGHPLNGDEAYRPNTFVWFHRRLRPEAPVPGKLEVLYRDDRLVVLDKPHFLATIPRGRHVMQSAVVKARAELGLPQLSAAHRLDRATAGVLLMTTEPRWRAAYQQLFATRAVRKTYHAIARNNPACPALMSSRLEKHVGELQVRTVAGTPNAHTELRMLQVHGPWGRYEATPLTGKTHQIRAHFNQAGIPIYGDPLYPQVRDVDIDDFRHPLRLLAFRLEFDDPIDGQPRNFRSQRTLDWPEHE